MIDSQEEASMIDRVSEEVVPSSSHKSNKEDGTQVNKASSQRAFYLLFLI